MPSGPPHPDDLPTPERCEERARERREQAAALIREAELYEAIAAGMRRLARGLPEKGIVTPQESGSIGGRTRRSRPGPVFDWLDSIGKNTDWLAAECQVSPATLRAMLAGKQGNQRPIVYASRAVMKAVEVLSRGWIRKGERKPRPLTADDWPHPEP